MANTCCAFVTAFRARTVGAFFAVIFSVAVFAQAPLDTLAPVGAEVASDSDEQVHRAAPALQSEFHVKSLRELRDEGVVRQRHDYSCGSAALATLLTYGLGDPVEEDVLLRTLFASRSQEQLDALTTKGLSLADLQRLAQARGHKAQGFRVHESQLVRLSRPVIVFIKPDGYEHFAVLKGLRGDRVYLADPSLGNVRMPLYRFLRIWSDASGRGVILAVERSAGDWPQSYPLEVAGRTDAPLEVLSAHGLLDIRAPLLSTLAHR